MKTNICIAVCELFVPATDVHEGNESVYGVRMSVSLRCYCHCIVESISSIRKILLLLMIFFAENADFKFSDRLYQ